MLEKPDLHDEQIITRLRQAYGLDITQVAFLPLGADPNSAVYRVIATDATPYFLKLRRGAFDETAVAVPKFLRDQGLLPVMAPIASKTQQLWTTLAGFKLILYPFVEGHNGFEADLSDQQWIALGATLKGVHTAVAPAGLLRRIPQETYSLRWRAAVKRFQERVEDHVTDDPAAARLAMLLQARRAEIGRIAGRAEQLALKLQAHSRPFVLCHADIHAGNVLLGPHDALAIVDWDNPILAPKERDLMFVGGGVGGVWRQARQEALFYQGYGRVEIDPLALAYYRYERIVEDIAVTCEQIFLTTAGGEDRAEGVQHLLNQFLPGNVVEIAHQSYELLGLQDGM